MTELKKITFIGGGNMARSLIGGLISDGYDPQNISVCDHDESQLIALKQWFPVNCDTQAEQLIVQADCVLFAVKPQVMQQAVNESLTVLLDQKPLIISIAAGVRIASIEKWLQQALPIIRCVPNTPALVQSGATALYANKHTSNSQKDFAESIMRAVGVAIWLQDEHDLDAVTALSGSGPAYFFLLMEAIQKAGQAMGLSDEHARLLTLETAFGAAKIALESEDDPAMLRSRVTSKRGTTESAISVLIEGNFMQLFEDALKAGQARAKELGDLLDQ